MNKYYSRLQFIKVLLLVCLAFALSPVSGQMREQTPSASVKENVGRGSLEKKGAVGGKGVVEKKNGNELDRVSERLSKGEAKKPSDSVVIPKDEIAFYGSVMQMLAWFITCAAVIFGAIVGINVFQGNSVLKEAREELKDARSELQKVQEARKNYEIGLVGLRETADHIFADTVAKIRTEAKVSLEHFVKNEFAITTAARYKRLLIDELSKDSPDLKQVFYHLTDIINYPDGSSLRIFAMCLDKCSNNEDIVRIVKRGLSISADATKNRTVPSAPNEVSG